MTIIPQMLSGNNGQYLCGFLIIYFQHLIYLSVQLTEFLCKYIINT